MTQLPLRRATAADAHDVRVITRSAYAKWVPLIGREPKPMTANYERAVIDHIIDLCEENGQLLALIEVVPRPDHLLIENIAIRPDRQGLGLGDKLLQHAEDQARALGLNETRPTRTPLSPQIWPFTPSAVTSSSCGKPWRRALWPCICESVSP